MAIEVVSHVPEFLGALDAAKKRALERIGMQAEGYAKDLAPVDTGDLRNSITHKVAGDDAYIGTNTEYAAYVELGTGKYYPGGRPTPWTYQDKSGQWHTTAGQRAQPYLKPAAANHRQTYINIIKDELGDA
ncbi:MAG: HK97 gp10 family phage protein [Clostridia bacterium]|nr:HK97 gp10 family phage protein [Clostridia bacterium]